MHYIALGAGADNPIGQFQATNETFTTLVICCKFQKNCFELWFSIVFIILYMRGQGQITPMG